MAAMMRLAAATLSRLAEDPKGGAQVGCFLLPIYRICMEAA
jgi:hypothetical protein